MRVVVLAGGVGAARFLEGLVRCVKPAEITVICNVSDDLEWHGLHVSPDIDTVIYTLAGLQGEQGWGIAGDTHVALEALRALGGEAWFGVGDRDLAMHLRRTELLRAGSTLAEATSMLAGAHGLEVRVLPVTNDAHPTLVTTSDGELPFQVYFVQRRAQDPVLALRFPGAATARPAPGVIEAIAGAEVVIVAPSNPFVSIGPLLAVPGVREALATTEAKRVAVSPIVGGEAIKGPAASMLASLGHEVSALGVARLYAGLVDCFVLDAVDAALAAEVESLGMHAVAFDTLMTDRAQAAHRGADAGRSSAVTSSMELPAVAVLVPVKRLEEAKSRLRDLGEAACRALVLAMLEDVLDAVREAAVGPLVLLSSDAAYDELAGRYGATRVADAPPSYTTPSYNGAVAAGLELAAVLEVGRALVLPADLPALRAADVRELARALEAAEVVLAPSDDGGTSALGLRPPGAMAPAFGLESAAAHRRQAAAAGLRLEELALPNLAVNVDTPSDLRAVASRVGPATARALQAFGLG